MRLGGAAFQVIETDEDACNIVMKKAHLGLLHPFPGLSVLAELDVGKVVEVLGAMEIIKHLSAIRED